MNITDYRFDSNLTKKLIGRKMIKYKCDRFAYSNTVTGVVGLYFDDEILEIHNEQEPVEYFGNYDDYSIWRIIHHDTDDIKSFFADTEMIDNPVNENVRRILLVNENQQLFKDNTLQQEYWITRAIIFDFGDHQLSFAKDNVAFSEEIEINKGYDLIEKVEKNSYFMGKWSDGMIPKISREIEVIE